MTKKKLALSVIIVTHNQADILALQIGSLQHQHNVKISDFEVIVTDDSSSRKEIGKIQRILRSSGLNCSLLQQRANKFWATKARNSAIRAAKGELLLFFDGDMVPETDVLIKHLNSHTSKQRHIVAGHRLRRRVYPRSGGVPNLDEFLNACRTSELSDSTLARWQREEEQRRSEFLQSRHPWRVVFSCHMSVRRRPEVFFDEHFTGWGPEDWELAYRLTHYHEYEVDFVPSIVAYEVDHLGEGIGNAFRTRTQEAVIDYIRNTFYFFDNCPGIEIEDVFWGFRKLELRNNSWIITPSNTTCNLADRVSEVRSWLTSNGYYSQMRRD